MKLFISVLILEGKGDVPQMVPISNTHEGGSPKPPMEEDQNQYKRIAEVCLDLNEITDQLVHELTLNLPVQDADPQPGPLLHALRQCEISGFDLQNVEDNSDFKTSSGSSTPNAETTPVGGRQKDLAVFYGQ